MDKNQINDLNDVQKEDQSKDTEDQKDIEDQLENNNEENNDENEDENSEEKGEENEEVEEKNKEDEQEDELDEELDEELKMKKELEKIKAELAEYKKENSNLLVDEFLKEQGMLEVKDFLNLDDFAGKTKEEIINEINPLVNIVNDLISKKIDNKKEEEKKLKGFDYDDIKVNKTNNQMSIEDFNKLTVQEQNELYEKYDWVKELLK